MKVNGLKTAIKAGEITPEGAIKKVKKDPYHSKYFIKWARNYGNRNKNRK